MTVTVGAAIDTAARRLAAAGIPDPRAEARRLLMLAAGYSTEQTIAMSDRELSREVEERLESFIARRAVHEPFAYIAGEREFWSLPFRVSPATLIPRPDTETVIEAALDYVRAHGIAAPRILDLGTGSGCILLALLSELTRATGIGIDVSEASLRVANENASALGLAHRASFRVGNWTDGIDGVFDLIVSNPPYISDGDVSTLDPDVALFEPHLALKGGADGLDSYRTLAGKAPSLLAPKGALVLEVGAGQADAVAKLLQSAGLDIVGVRADLAGIPRCVIATWPENQENPGFGR